MADPGVELDLTGLPDQVEPSPNTQEFDLSGLPDHPDPLAPVLTEETAQAMRGEPGGLYQDAATDLTSTRLFP